MPIGKRIDYLSPHCFSSWAWAPHCSFGKEVRYPLMSPCCLCTSTTLSSASDPTTQNKWICLFLVIGLIFPSSVFEFRILRQTDAMAMSWRKTKEQKLVCNVLSVKCLRGQSTCRTSTKTWVRISVTFIESWCSSSSGRWRQKDPGRSLVSQSRQIVNSRFRGTLSLKIIK